jgi:hypothetical protein
MQEIQFLTMVIFFGLFFVFFIAIFYLAVSIKPKKDRSDRESWTLPTYLLEELLKQKEKTLTETK